MQTDDVRAYFRSFRCEQLTADQKNRELIGHFSSNEKDRLLEAYLKAENGAWAEDSDGETRVYLVKDPEDRIALFFSLKCGLLISEGASRHLTEEEAAYVNVLTEMLLENAGKDEFRNLYEYGESVFGVRVENLWRLAQDRMDRKKDAADTKQELRWSVDRCVSAIELRHFCRNASYEAKEFGGIRLGFGLFWEQIVPMLLDITKKVGCRYVYLFAADNTGQRNDQQLPKLVSYYKNVLKFCEPAEEDLITVKPRYDRWCYGLIQDVHKLQSNQERIWLEFADIIH